MDMLKAGALMLILALTVGANATATARYTDPVTVEGVEFAPRPDAADMDLQLVGYGVATARIFFDVYAAALYLPPAADADSALAEETPRRLEIQYLLDLEADDLARAANTILQRQHDKATLEGVREGIEQLHALYRDVGPGDRYAMTYRPGDGTTLTLNGEPQGTIPGGDFARIYFGIWLGKEPLSEALREKLLGRA
ncbi:chalcone isomerase family protein [Ectothiorhodospiraceae bacterium WFHF3C12]|nr:chalcone isomerase family protein [Ectothiorhodospiraceae bacterium WFHF3C12]